MSLGPGDVVAEDAPRTDLNAPDSTQEDVVRGDLVAPDAGDAMDAMDALDVVDAIEPMDTVDAIEPMDTPTLEDAADASDRVEIAVGDDVRPPLDVADVLRLPTSLQGDYACGTMTCGTGQVCVHRSGGVDTGLPNPPTCETVPPSCLLYDCVPFRDVSNSCCDPMNLCGHVLCMSSPIACFGASLAPFAIHARSIECYGQ